MRESNVLLLSRMLVFRSISTFFRLNHTKEYGKYNKTKSTDPLYHLKFFCFRNFQALYLVKVQNPPHQYAIIYLSGYARCGWHTIQSACNPSR